MRQWSGIVSGGAVSPFGDKPPPDPVLTDQYNLSKNSINKGGPGYCFDITDMGYQTGNDELPPTTPVDDDDDVAEAEMLTLQCHFDKYKSMRADTVKSLI